MFKFESRDVTRDYTRDVCGGGELGQFVVGGERCRCLFVSEMRVLSLGL